MRILTGGDNRAVRVWRLDGNTYSPNWREEESK
jgi:hypothetical protein